MQLTLRTMAPILAAALVALAGCQTAPQKESTPPATGPSEPAPATPTPYSNSSVQLYVAQRNAEPGLTEVKMSDGSLYLQSPPVLTRQDLTEASALVDRQGRNFVGLRFTEGGARKLYAASTQNVGQRLALVLGRDLVAAPQIAEPLNRGLIVFAVDSAQTAADIVARIRGEATPARPATGTPAPGGGVKPSGVTPDQRTAPAAQ